jgi:hypothetical protein
MVNSTTLPEASDDTMVSSASKFPEASKSLDEFLQAEIVSSKTNTGGRNLNKWFIVMGELIS